MPGIKQLRVINFGQESTPGTAVAATARFRGEGMLKDELELTFPEETIGYLPGLDRSYIARLGATMQLSSPANFEQWPYVANAGIGLVVPTTDTGSGYIWTHTMPILTGLASSDIKTLTIEGGDNQENEEMEYSFVEDFEMAGKAGEAWMLTHNWRGRQVTVSAVTPSTDIAIPNIEDMLFSKSLLYIDPTSDAVGTTLKSNTFLDCSIKVKTGLQIVEAADGQLYFSFIKGVQPEVTIDITFEHDGTATAEKAFWRSQTARQIRILCRGSALTVAGAYTYKTWQGSFAGKWESFDKIDELNGNDVIKATYRARYNSVAALFAAFVCVNELPVMP